jgi:hypothetical protein
MKTQRKITEVDIDFLSQDKLVAENEISWFYTNTLTSSATQYARKKGLKSYTVLKVTSKEDSSSCYVMIDTEKNTYEYDNTNYEAVLYHIDMLGFAKS